MDAMSTRRDLLNGIVGLSVGTFVLGYATPIAIDEMYRVAPPESACLVIEADDTHTITAGNTGSFACVELEDTGSQLELEDTAILELTES